MHVIGVVDLLGGRAVHARGGDRARYAPVQAPAVPPGDAVALARRYAALGVTDLYAADLDAIGSPESEDLPHADLLATLAAGRPPLWLDAGVSTVARARRAASLGAARVVVGLETLASYDGLAGVSAALGRGRTAFSLDLRGGAPVPGRSGFHPGRTAAEVARRAAQAGIGAIIVLDLGRVGSAAGPDLDVMARVRAAAPAVVLLAGGGIRGPVDLERLAGLGCDGALVASALLDGRLSSGDVAIATGYRSVRR